MMKLNKIKFSSLYKMSSGISSKPEQAGHGAPFASFSTVFNNFFMPEFLPDLMNTSKREQEVYSIKRGDIFLTRTSETLEELGMSCVALKDYPTATFSGFVKRLRPIKDKVTDERYMGFYLRTKFFRKTMTNNAIMTLRASLNEEIFSYLDLYLPEYNTQKRVGKFLFQLQNKIEINKRINAELEAIVKTLYDYWFVQFDFPDENNKPYKTSGGKMVWNEEIGQELPEGWGNEHLENLTKGKHGIVDGPFGTQMKTSEYKTEGVPVIEMDYLKGFPFYRDFRNYISDEKFKAVSRSAVFKDDIIMSKTGTLGLLGIMTDKWDKAIIVSRLLKITVDKNKIPMEYIFYTLKKFSDLKYWNKVSFGSTMPIINLSHLKKLNIIIPPAQLTILFENIASRILTQQKSNLEQNELLSNLRDWLLPMLMNGQVKVKEAEEMVNMAADQTKSYTKPVKAF